MNFLKFIQESGPYSTPLAVGMVLVIGWLMKQLKKVQAECAVARADASGLRDKRYVDLQAAAKEYAEIGESTRNLMREWKERAAEVLAELRKRG
jgi:hypothetical protein